MAKIVTVCWFKTSVKGVVNDLWSIWVFVLLPQVYLGKQTVSSKSIISFCAVPEKLCFPFRLRNLGFSCTRILVVITLFSASWGTIVASNFEFWLQTFQGKKFHPALMLPVNQENDIFRKKERGKNVICKIKVVFMNW